MLSSVLAFIHFLDLISNKVISLCHWQDWSAVLTFWICHPHSHPKSTPLARAMCDLFFKTWSEVTTQTFLWDRSVSSIKDKREHCLVLLFGNRLQGEWASLCIESLCLLSCCTADSSYQGLFYFFFFFSDSVFFAISFFDLKWLSVENKSLSINTNITQSPVSRTAWLFSGSPAVW